MIEQENISLYEQLTESANEILLNPSPTLKQAIQFRKALEEPIKTNLVLIISGKGKEEDSLVYHLVQFLLERNLYKDYKFVWQTVSKKRAEELEKNSTLRDKILFCYKRGKEYIELLANAAFIISEVTLPSYYIRRSGQVYCNIGNYMNYNKESWELRKVSFDKKRVMIKEYLHTSFLVSISDTMTKEYYFEKYQMKNLYDGYILQLDEFDEKGMQIFWDFIFTGETKDGKVVSAANIEKRILVIGDFTKYEWWQDRLFRVLKKQYREKDVSILTPAIKSTDQIRKLEASNLRILMKTGYINVLDHEFSEVYCLEKGSGYEGAYQKNIDKISQETLDMEWNRLVGTKQFDEVILCDSNEQKQYFMWLKLIEVTSRKKTILYNWRNLNCLTKDSGYIKTWINFSEIKCISEYDRKKAEILSNDFEAKCVICQDIIQEGEFYKHETCTYQDQSYNIVSMIESGVECEVSIIKQPDKLFNNYAINISSHNRQELEKVLEYFADIYNRDNEARFHIFDSIQFWDERYLDLFPQLSIGKNINVYSGYLPTVDFLKRIKVYIEMQSDIYGKLAQKLNVQILKI